MTQARCLLAITSALGLLSSPARADDPAPDGLAAFRKDVRPILVGTCLTCHGPDRKKGGLDLSRSEAARAGGDAGAAIVPGKPDESLLIQKVEAGEMPPKTPLRPEEVAALRRWVEAGAPYDREALVAPKKEQPPLWSLQPVRRPELPRSRFDQLARTPIDRFLFAKMEAGGLTPSPLADRRALIRRISFDLTGLPPTPEEVSAFEKDAAPDAYEKLVDRLLDSPAYGERWARHWLDVVRFGESHGYEQNHLRDNAWYYRDYVIRALNEDKPYGRFVAEQLAGDVLAEGDASIASATGFLVAGVHDTVGIQTVEGTLQQRANDLDDIVSTIGATFLGLTVGCARCHDHKFDPIPQRDYYRLTAVVSGVRHAERPLPAPPPPEEERRALASAEARTREIASILDALDARARQEILHAQGVDRVPRPAVNPRRNVEEFAPVLARFVRMTILATRDGSEPCLDELEVYGSVENENLALASRGAKASASSLLPGYDIHQIAHLNDGRLGNGASWISRERGRGWVQIELAKSEAIRRVVWGRDGAGDKPRFSDRLAMEYRVEVSADSKDWTLVADSSDRATAPEAIPRDKLDQAMGPEDQSAREALLGELAILRERLKDRRPTAYIGEFTAHDPIFVLQRGDVMQRGESVGPAALSQIASLSGELDLGIFPPLPEDGERGEEKTATEFRMTARPHVAWPWRAGSTTRGIRYRIA